MQQRIKLSLTTAVVAAFLAGCAQTPTSSSSKPATAAAPAAAPAATPSVLDTARKQAQLSTFVQLTQAAGLTDALGATGTYTVFAPSNDAFAALPAATLEKLKADPAALKGVLSHHVLTSRVAAAEVKPGKAKTLLGTEVVTGATAGFATVEDALVTQADLGATNGVVHVIDRVLMPPKK